MILHICNNYISSKVHVELVGGISRSEKSQAQYVYVPIRDSKHRDVNCTDADRVEVDYDLCLNRVIKYFPLTKIFWVFASLFFRKNQAIKSAKIILAHTLWSDGAVAFFLSKFTGVKYVLVVRNTDINWFLPRLPHYRWLVKKIISSSNGLIFVSPAYRDFFSKKYPKLYSVAPRVKIIPNGVSSFWIENIISLPTKRAPVVFFAGRFDENKNLPAIYLSTLRAREKVPQLGLHLAGGEEKEFKRLTELDDIPCWVKVLGKIDDQHVMKEHYRKAAVFLMPSFHETFGLVYLEALSQGCPYVHTRGEGIDGYFSDPVFSRSVDPENVEEISSAIVCLIAEHPLGVSPGLVRQAISEFNWKSISNEYVKALS